MEASLSLLNNQFAELKEYHRQCSNQQSSCYLVSIKDESVHINGLKIIEAKLQFAVFKTLINQYINEFFTSKLKYLTISQISSLLESEGFFIEDQETQIRNAIYYIRTSIKSSDINSNIDSVIVSKKWDGYRISDEVFLKKF